MTGLKEGKGGVAVGVWDYNCMLSCMNIHHSRAPMAGGRWALSKLGWSIVTSGVSRRRRRREKGGGAGYSFPRRVTQLRL